MSAKEYFQRDQTATVFQLQPSFGTGCLYLHQRSASNHHGAEKHFIAHFIKFADALMSHGQQQRRKSELLLRKLPV